KIEILARFSGGQPVKGFHMSRSQVFNVDIVSDAGPIWGRVVVAVDLEREIFPIQALQDTRNEVRFRIVRFPQFSADTGSCSVKVTQRYRSKAICAVIALQDSLDKVFGLPVRVHWILRMRF